MSQESYIKNNVEQATQLLTNYKGKVEKFRGITAKLALVIAILNLILLIAVPFMSFRGESVSMFEIFDYDHDALGGTKFFYVVNWLSTVAVGIIAIVTLKNPESKSWIKAHCFGGGLDFLMTLILFITHMSAESEITYAHSSCFFWRVIPMLAAIVYFIIPIFASIYNMYIPVLEKNISEYEKQD